MTIDWSKVAETGVTIVPTAVVGAYVGARIKAYLDRARPEISITACRLGTISDLVGLKLRIPETLTQHMRQLAWADTLVGEINAGRLSDEIDNLRDKATRARNAIQYVEDKLSQLPGLDAASIPSKLSFLDEISRQDISLVPASMAGALARQEIILPTLDDAELAKLTQVTTYQINEEKEAGFLIYLRRRWWPFTQGDKRLNDYLLPGVKALCWFHVPSIKAILEHVKTDLSRLAIDGETLATEMSIALKQVQPLVIELSLVNKGRSSVIFTPWAALRLLHEGGGKDVEINLRRAPDYWKPEDPIMATQQRKLLMDIKDVPCDDLRFYTIDGGKGVTVKYHSVRPLADLERDFNNLASILTMDYFRCQVVLKRADIAKPKESWTASTIGLFGKCGEQFPQKEIATITKKWR